MNKTTKSLTKEEQVINNYINKTKEYSFVKLKGDASERQYYRTLFKDNSPSLILMVPSLLSQKEEQEKYINIRNYLSDFKVNVPLIYHYDEPSKIMLLEDLGDTLLYDIIKKTAKETFIPLYKKAIDELIKIQFKTLSGSRNCSAFTISFDEEKLMWELNFFLTHAQKIFNKIPSPELAKIREDCKKIVATLACEPQVLNHRDYHSKNLMVQHEQIKIIDFQDARLGPCQYDLVSLIKDSYANLDFKLIQELIEYYLEQKETIEQKKENREKFFYIFDLMTFQRSLKACGTFCYLNIEKQRSEYMEHYPIALNYAKESLKNKDEYRLLLENLCTYFK